MHSKTHPPEHLQEIQRDVVDLPALQQSVVLALLTGPRLAGCAAVDYELCLHCLACRLNVLPRDLRSDLGPVVHDHVLRISGTNGGVRSCAIKLGIVDVDQRARALTRQRNRRLIERLETEYGLGNHDVRLIATAHGIRVRIDLHRLDGDQVEAVLNSLKTSLP